MKKIISALLVITLVIGSSFAFSSCAKKGNEKFDIALITDGATVNDNAYNKSAWEGVKAYAEENKLTCRYYQPSLDEEGNISSETAKNYIELAVKNGAKSIVLPGEKFAVSAYEIAPTYKDVNFILIDAVPHSESDKTVRMQSNVMCISFNALQAGFLAGYTSVLEGNTKLGYLGSVESESSLDYGAGFVQGAGYAADEKSIPAYMDYANYDAENLKYDYSFTIKPVYKKIEEAKKKTFKVTVKDGIGSGVYTDGENVKITANPAPEGKCFDHWETKSNTEGVKDKKVNISSKKKTEMNLLVGDCDCTITAVWADVKTIPITIKGSDGNSTAGVIYATENSTNWVCAPSAPAGTVFDHWETDDESVVEDLKSSGTNVKVTDSPITMTPVFVKSETPTFTVTVENGTGSGTYLTEDEVYITANAPQDGYMFYKWENIDNQGLSTGIAMENEYCYTTKFEMVDRYASVVEAMIDDGCTLVFGGGNPISDSIFTAEESFDYIVNAFGYGYDESSKGDTLASVVNDYGAAVKLALKDFKGASVLEGNIANGCIYVTGKDLDEFQLDDKGQPVKDKKGNKIKNGGYNADYTKTFYSLKKGEIKILKATATDNIIYANKSKCL
ncbi:MAG: BMP family ABC transporter substrate-binding protein, partial [Eubacterium sp.]|nr:BMP family ABC transporter substrate-binding protein [Eubacterium sp.]